MRDFRGACSLKHALFKRLADIELGIIGIIVLRCDMVPEIEVVRAARECLRVKKTSQSQA